MGLNASKYIFLCVNFSLPSFAQIIHNFTNDKKKISIVGLCPSDTKDLLIFNYRPIYYSNKWESITILSFLDWNSLTEVKKTNFLIWIEFILLISKQKYKQKAKNNTFWLIILNDTILMLSNCIWTFMNDVLGQIKTKQTLLKHSFQI